MTRHRLGVVYDGVVVRTVGTAAAVPPEAVRAALEQEWAEECAIRRVARLERLVRWRLEEQAKAARRRWRWRLWCRALTGLALAAMLAANVAAAVALGVLHL